MPRRRLVLVAGAAAAIGAGWATGLSVLARGRRPQLLVVGDNDWQVVLIEHLARRMLIFSGAPAVFPDSDLRRLMSVLRQRIDLIAGESAVLDLIPATFLRRYEVGRRLMLDRDEVGSNPQETLAIADGVEVTCGAFEVHLTPIHHGEWSLQPMRRTWLATVRIEGLSIGISPSLDVIARHQDPDIDLAIAPSGHQVYLNRMLPHVAIVTNAAGAQQAGLPTHESAAEGNAYLLARVFREEVTRLVIRNGSLIMPAWTETVSRDARLAD